MPTKLLIVDDHEIVRRGIAEMVDTADVQVVAEASAEQVLASGFELTV